MVGRASADALPVACLQIWWLDPELTYGSAKPFVFTQGHSVCNRSFFPCFDTPAVKCTYSAVVKVNTYLSGLLTPPRPSGITFLEGPHPPHWGVGGARRKGRSCRERAI